jgi:hypothetical protein
MKTIQEKTTFIFSALFYLLFHLRGGATAGAMLAGTVMQLLTTLPYCIGFTFITVRVIQYVQHGKQIPWDRIALVFFTIGIFFGFFFALYEYAEQGQSEQALQTKVDGNAAYVNGKEEWQRKEILVVSGGTTFRRPFQISGTRGT